VIPVAARLAASLERARAEELHLLRRHGVVASDTLLLLLHVLLVDHLLLLLGLALLVVGFVKATNKPG